ncbi:N-acetyltransferase [Legionella pneumophila serogroup 1]|nr:N-acetyltransferase [Legionella pneumophila subsp. fraseri]MDX1846890.1 N-acetyltransferase [Legionella pneumophila subsp. fraseri]
MKQENGAISDVNPPLPPEQRIKVGTMKINAHGTKLGERFIKKIFDHAIFENAKEIYVTIFPHHITLVKLFERYGFNLAAEKLTKNGKELVLVKKLYEQHTDVISNYPLVNIKKQKVYLLSLYPKWHTRLLPDSILKSENNSVVQDISHTNSIHKVYLSSMNGMDTLKRGDVLVIYRTSDNKGPARYRSVVTSVCVVEEYKSIHEFTNLEQFLSYCNPYSVFEEPELLEFWNNKKYVHIIRFTYNLALKKRIIRDVLINQIGLNENQYWGFMSLTKEQFLEIIHLGEIDENLIVH